MTQRYPPKKVIIFDLGDVLLRLNWEKTLVSLGVPNENPQELFRKILTSHSGIYDRFERGMMQEKEFFTRFKKELSISSDIDTIAKAWEYLIIGPVEGIEEIMNRIPKNYHLYILSNVSENMYHYLKIDHTPPLFPILSRFKKFFASFKLKARKPEKEIYDQVFQDLKSDHPHLLPSEILMIDDRQDNADGAHQSGWVGEKSEPADAKSVEAILKRHQVI